MSIEQQRELLNELAQYVYDSAEENCEEIKCEFWINFDVSEGSVSVRTELTFTKNGQLSAAFLRAPNGRKLIAVKELHKAMFDHTGGSWDSFILSLNKDNNISTNFRYGDSKA